MPRRCKSSNRARLAALVRVIGKPIDFFAQIPGEFGPSLGARFRFRRPSPTTTRSASSPVEEYPTLVPEGEKIDTIAVPTVLAVFNWPKGNDRYRRVQRFTEALFTKWDKFSEPHRHPKWRDVNLAATVPGWTRWSVAEEMLGRMRQTDPRGGEFWSSKHQGPAVTNLTQEQREALYQEFLKWQKQRSSVQR